MSDKKKCPESFIAVGAALLMLRYAAFDLDQLFEGVEEALDGTYKDLYALKVHRTQLSEAEKLLHVAQGAKYDIMKAHESLRLLVEKLGFETPSMSDLQSVLAKQHAAKPLPVREAVARLLTQPIPAGQISQAAAGWR